MALNAESLEHYRRILNARRDELAAGSLRAEAQVSEQTDDRHLDPIDRATAEIAADDLLQGVTRDSGQVVQIDDALRRMDAGVYGICAVCGMEIPKARLDAVPSATLCVLDQEAVTQEAFGQGGAPSRVA